MKKMILPIFIAGLLGACTDASWGKYEALGEPASVKCYSGGELIYEGVSTGKVQSESSSDGYYFKERGTEKIKEVSGDCIITYDVD